MGIEEQIKKADLKGAMFTALITALAFVAGLFWNDAIRSAIDVIIPDAGNKISAKFIAAIVVTLLVVIVGYILIKTQEIGSKYSRNIEQTLKKQREEFEKVVQNQKELIEKQRKKMREQEEKLRHELRKEL